MDWLNSPATEIAAAAGKAALMYVVALAGLRIGERRTLAQWTAVDFVAAVAIGAIVGRTAVAKTQSFVVGAVALLAVLLVHRLAVQARFVPLGRRFLEHSVVVLVRDGTVDPKALRRCGLTKDDLAAALRQRGVFDLAAVRYALYEAKGGLTVVPHDAPGPFPLLDDAGGGRPAG